MYVYLVELVGNNLYHLFGIYGTYEDVMNRWDEERRSMLDMYEEYKRVEDEEHRLGYSWENEVYIYSADTYEEYEHRFVEKRSPYIDHLRIISHKVL